MTQETLSGRGLEAHVLTKAANKLKACRSNWNDPNVISLLNDALKYNQKVWTFFRLNYHLMKAVYQMRFARTC